MKYLMPQFLTNSINALYGMAQDVWLTWQGISESQRILGALVLCGLLIYRGSQSDRSAVSAGCFFAAFTLFTYIIILGMAHIQ